MLFKRMLAAMAALLGLGLGAVSAQAQDCVYWDTGPNFRATEVVRYVAHISVNDLYASDGYPLSLVHQVLRQDRANYHRFGLRDPWDGPDGFFGNPGNRAVFDRAQVIYYCHYTRADINALNAGIVSGRLDGVLQVVVYRKPVGAWRVFVEPVR